MYHKPARNVCFIAMVILLSSILGCGRGEEQPDAKGKAPAQELTEPDSKEPGKEDNTEAKAGKQETKTIKVIFIELGSVKCTPCKMMEPIMKEIEKEYGDQVKVVFHDVRTREGKPYARKYGIRVIPTQVFLDREGNEYFRHEGFFAKDELVKILERQGVK